MSSPVHADHRDEDKLGTLAMRVIGTAIVLGIIWVLAYHGFDLDWFPYGVYGFVGAVVLAAVSFAVAQVK
jgi:hypothetical protein